jgi:heat-inducible transcriptional repressor
MVVLITDTGRVEQRMIELPDVTSEDSLAEIRKASAELLIGLKIDAAAARLAELADSVRPELRGTTSVLATALLESIVERPDVRVAVGGTANLARTNPWDFPMTLRPVLEALEEQVVLLKLLGTASEHNTVTITIGEEHAVEGLRTASMVTTGYGNDTGALGSMGVVGPTRMDYAGSIAAVRAVASYVGELLGGQP